MLTLEHVALGLLAIALLHWWWRGMGLRDLALRQVQQHCQQADVQLLDQSIVLRRLRPQRNRHGRWRMMRRYGFEFTVTGERRYGGHIELHGARLQAIHLDPHPFPGADAEQPTDSNVVTFKRPLH